jgi:hypothetical protein
VNPAGPSNVKSPRVSGIAPTDTTVRIFTTSDCSGTQVGQGTAAAFSGSGVAASAALNTTSQFFANDSNAAGTSACSSTSVSYTEDSIAPATPAVTSSIPASPGKSITPHITGTAEAGTTVQLFKGGCSTTRLAVGTASAFASPGIRVTVTADAATTLYAQAVDAAGNKSPCSAPFKYIEDSTAPAAPVLSSTSPASPGKSIHPHVIGSAETGSTVRLFKSPDCTGTPAASGKPAALASTGIAVTVPANSTTSLSATATDKAGNVSACSASLDYAEDSTPPAAPVISGSNPASPGQSTTPQIFGSAEAGSTVNLYEGPCSTAPVGSGTAAGFSSPGITATVPASATTTFHAKAVDAAGNSSTCSAGFKYVETP